MSFPTQEHIDAAQAAAERVRALTGFYCWPSVTLAQALIESASWTKLSGRNNGFGIKANATQIAAGAYTVCRTREVRGGRSVMVDAKFANFATLADAYEAHAMLFVRVSDYAAGLKAKNAVDFINAVGPHYASEPTYARTIIGEMSRLGLYQYDVPHGASPPPPDAPAVAPPVASPTLWHRVVDWFGFKIG